MNTLKLTAQFSKVAQNRGQNSTFRPEDTASELRVHQHTDTHYAHGDSCRQSRGHTPVRCHLAIVAGSRFHNLLIKQFYLYYLLKKRISQAQQCDNCECAHRDGNVYIIRINNINNKCKKYNINNT